LVRHGDEVAGRGEAVGLELVVGAVDAGAAGEEEEELAWLGGVGGGLGEVDFDVGDAGYFL